MGRPVYRSKAVWRRNQQLSRNEWRRTPPFPAQGHSFPLLPPLAVSDVKLPICPVVMKVWGHSATECRLPVTCAFCSLRSSRNLFLSPHFDPADKWGVWLVSTVKTPRCAGWGCAEDWDVLKIIPWKVFSAWLETSRFPARPLMAYSLLSQKKASRNHRSNLTINSTHGLLGMAA